MIFALFKSVIRSLQNRKGHLMLSVFTLSTGFSAFILITLFIKYELNWDRFNENYDHIYRVQTFKTISDELIMQSAAAVSEHIKNNPYDGIKYQSLVFPDWEVYLGKSKTDVVVKEKGQLADQNFLQIFSYDFIAGKKEESLIEPFSIVLSESFAKDFFDNSLPIGQTMVMDKKHTLKITGIYRDLPKNAHLRPKYIISINSLKTLWNNPDVFDDWGSTPYYTYIQTKEDADIAQLGKELKELSRDKLDTDYRQLFLRPLSDLYMYSTNNNYTIILYLLGLFSSMVLVLSAINFMNLSIASGSLRGKEIGIKKVIGSNRRILIAQIFFENLIITVFSLAISLLMVELSLNTFNMATEKQISLSLFFEVQFYLIVFASIFVASITSSIYPSWLITSVSSLDLFKKKFTSNKRSQANLKKYLVGFQFAISIGLITVAILMSRQIHHMYTQELGFEKSQLVFVEISSTEKNTTISKMKNLVNANTDVEIMSASLGFPTHSSKYTYGPMINWEGSPREELLEVRSFWVCHDFIKTMNMEIVKGRDFSRAHSSDVSQACLINETAARQFGWEDPIGKYIDDKKLKVVGVFKDILFHDVYNEIKPLMLTLVDDEELVQGSLFFGFRIRGRTFESVKSTIENTLSLNFPNDPFAVKQFDDHYSNDQVFKVFHTIKSLFIFFSIIGALLSVFGIIGLVNYSLNRRTKEIAIRKISGCSSVSIFNSLIIEFVVIIILAAVFGTVGAQYIFNKLPIYHPMDPRWLDYLVGVTIALGISLIAISFKTFKESIRNPVEALRYE